MAMYDQANTSCKTNNEPLLRYTITGCESAKPFDIGAAVYVRPRLRRSPGATGIMLAVAVAYKARCGAPQSPLRNIMELLP
jgi:hypothetical protein